MILPIFCKKRNFNCFILCGNYFGLYNFFVENRNTENRQIIFLLPCAFLSVYVYRHKKITKQTNSFQTAPFLTKIYYKNAVFLQKNSLNFGFFKNNEICNTLLICHMKFYFVMIYQSPQNNDTDILFLHK